MSQEQCRVCRDGQTITFTDGESIPLCNGHWNVWLGRYLGNDDAPCAAHVLPAALTPATDVTGGATGPNEATETPEDTHNKPDA